MAQTEDEHGLHAEDQAARLGQDREAEEDAGHDHTAAPAHPLPVVEVVDQREHGDNERDVRRGECSVAEEVRLASDEPDREPAAPRSAPGAAQAHCVDQQHPPEDEVRGASHWQDRGNVAVCVELLSAAPFPEIDRQSLDVDRQRHRSRGHEQLVRPGSPTREPGVQVEWFVEGRAEFRRRREAPRRGSEPEREQPQTVDPSRPQHAFPRSPVRAARPGR